MKSATVEAAAPEFALPDANGKTVSLADVLAKGPALLVFYPGDFTLVCTKQLCDYRDRFDEFKDLGIQVVGISANPPTSHARFAKRYAFPFKLLTDEESKVAKAYNCTSAYMLGRVSRACFIVNKQGVIVYRYVEPTILTRRNSGELLEILRRLRADKLV